MRFRAVLLAGCLLLALPSTAVAGEKPWMEVRSQHFRVLTNGNLGDARHVAHEFEQMRYVCARLFPNFHLDSGAPLLIFAVRDEQTAKALEPRLWAMPGVKPAGEFHHSWEKQYVMVRLDSTGVNVRAIVYHEYIHSILHMNAHWLPVWLDEGVAELYAYTLFESHQMYVGAPTQRVRELRGRPIPVETLLTVDRSSPYYHDLDKAPMFYAESWALVHYMTFGPDMGGGARFNQFYNKLQDGVPQQQAFQQVFGSPADMDRALDQYMQHFAFHAAVLQDPPQINEKTFATRTLTLAETDAELGGFHLWTHDLAGARPLIAQALQQDAKLGLAHEENGFLLFGDGNDAVAEEEFTQACALDPSLYLALFAQTMLSPAATSTTPGAEAEFHGALVKVVNLNPQFAPAYVQLARLSLLQNDPGTAFSYSRRAEKLEPWRAGYHLLSGEILLRMGKGSEAADFAKFVADHWSGPDHNEAVELWNRIPAAQRPAGVVLSESAVNNSEEAKGTVSSVSCTPGKRLTFTLAQDGRQLTFRYEGPFAMGFSDTLWYGEDHFSLCHHLEGMRAVVHYRPAVNASYAGDLVEIELRQDTPAPSGPSGGPVAAAQP